MVAHIQNIQIHQTERTLSHHCKSIEGGMLGHLMVQQYTALKRAVILIHSKAKKVTPFLSAAQKKKIPLLNQIQFLIFFASKQALFSLTF